MRTTFLKNKLFPLFFVICLASFNRAFSQVTLDYDVDSVNIGTFYPIDLGGNNFKFLKLNTAANTFTLYNMNMTVYMTVAIPPSAPTLASGYIPIYVTTTLFDCDSTNIEYAYSNPYASVIADTFYIFRTNGNLLLKVDSANGPYAIGGWGGSFDVRPIINTSAGTKLLLQKYDPRGQPEELYYSLCGTLPESVYDFSQGNRSYVKVYPNPSSMLLNFEINAPNNQEEFQLIIFDVTGKEYNRVTLASAQYKYTMDVNTLSSGTYIYTLNAKNKVYQTGKFVITK